MLLSGRALATAPMPTCRTVLRHGSFVRLGAKQAVLPGARVPRCSERSLSSTRTALSANTMQAVLVQGGVGPASSLCIGPAPMPTLSSRPLADGAGAEVLVKVKAFGLNRMDILQREGKYPLPPGTSEILGVEFSGVVEAVGPAVDTSAEPDPANKAAGLELAYHPRVGDEVFGLALGGAYAEYIKVRSSLLLPKPEFLSWTKAAAIPENWLTAFQALRSVADLRPPSEWDEQTKTERRETLGLDPSVANADELQEIGKDVLVHAGASGVGLAAIQLARDLGARKVFATAGSEEKVAVCVNVAGADAGWNYKATDWEAALAAHNGLEGKKAKAGSVDVIVDFVVGSYWSKNVSSLRRDGRVVILATLGGAKVKDAPMLPLVFKRLRIEGSTLRSRSLGYQGNLVQAFLRQGVLDRILAGLDAPSADTPGGVTPHHILLHRVASWRDIEALHLEMEANRNIGKMVATID